MDWCFIFGLPGSFLLLIVLLFVFGRRGRQTGWIFGLALILSLTFFTFPRPPGTEVSGVVEEVQTYRFFVKDGRARYAFEGEWGGVQYHLVSCDALGFTLRLLGEEGA